MTYEELEEIRYKHRPCESCVVLDDCDGCNTCDVDEYPCDVIRLLDYNELLERNELLNQQDRDELRARHFGAEYADGRFCHECNHAYPCDVIKVLDAWENDAE